MPTNHAAVAALPIVGSANKTLLRDLLVANMPYVLTDAADVTDLVAVDPDTGTGIIDILFLGRLFHYDPTDTTTANDGISCLVTSDGHRYKLSDGSDVFAYSVLDNAVATPPVSPSISDAYLVAAGATGAWSGKSGYIATFTRRGWEFINFGIGRFIYVESTDTYYHKESGGSWVAGFGNNTFNANSIPFSAAINFGARVRVENQTTNTPPASPSLGDAYVIGPSPTGAWAGAAAQIAICEDGATWTIYNLGLGYLIYDKAQAADYRFDGSSWIPLLGAWRTFSQGAFTDGSTPAGAVGSSGYSYSGTSAPDTSSLGIKDNVTKAYAAQKVGATLRIQYRVDITGTVSSRYTLAMFIDSNANAVDWCAIDTNGGGGGGGMFDFVTTAADTSSHTYHFRIIRQASFAEASISRRQIMIEEAF